MFLITVGMNVYTAVQPCRKKYSVADTAVFPNTGKRNRDRPSSTRKTNVQDPLVSPGVHLFTAWYMTYWDRHFLSYYSARQLVRIWGLKKQAQVLDKDQNAASSPQSQSWTYSASPQPKIIHASSWCRALRQILYDIVPRRGTSSIIYILDHNIRATRPAFREDTLQAENRPTVTYTLQQSSRLYCYTIVELWSTLFRLLLQQNHTQLTVSW